MSRPAFTRSVEKFTVHIDAHHVPPRFDIPETERTVYAPDRVWAIQDVVRAVAREHGCGLWKPWLRAIAKHARIVNTETEEVPL